MCQKTKATKHVSTPHIPPAKITKSANGRTDGRTNGRTDICFSSLTNGKALRAITPKKLQKIARSAIVQSCNRDRDINHLQSSNKVKKHTYKNTKEFPELDLF